MNNDDMAILKTMIMTWTDEQVKEAWSLISAEGNRRNDVNKRKMKKSLQPGDTVTFNGSRSGPSTGTVVKVKIKKAIVEVAGQRWDVPLHMLRKQQ